MARVNIEDKFFNELGFRMLSRISGLSEAECVGHLVLLWHTSQLEKMVSCNELELIVMLNFEKSFDEKKIKSFVTSLVQTGFLTEAGGEYLIVGNDKQIKSLNKYLKSQAKNGKKGGRPTKSQTKANEKPNESQTKPKITPITSTITSTNTTTVQDNVVVKREVSEINKRSGSLSGSEKSSPPINKKIIPKVWESKIDHKDDQLADEWLDHANEVSTTKGKFNRDKFRLAICQMREIHNLTHGEIAHVLKFASTDDFWRGKALSPVSLLKPSKSNPDILKLEQIILGIKNKPKSKADKSWDTVRNYLNSLEGQ